jgi:hypothetical protein
MNQLGAFWELERRPGGLFGSEWSIKDVIYGLETSWGRGHGCKEFEWQVPIWVANLEEGESLMVSSVE